MKIDLEHTLNEVVKIAKRTGEFIRHEGSRFDRSKVEEKGTNNLVSFVDTTAERMIAQTLKFTLPDAGFITEEGTETEKSDDLNWVVDPLDGTTNFIHGLAPYSISIALMKKNEPIIGVIYEVKADECFCAVKGGGAFLNRKKIHVSTVKDFKDGLYITGIPYIEFDKNKEFFEVLNEFIRNSHGIRRLGSAAADMAYVACGRAEGFFEHGLNPWDIAAGSLIVKEAGGIVTDYKGKDDYIFGREIIAGCAVQPEMQKIISSVWHKKQKV